MNYEELVSILVEDDWSDADAREYLDQWFEEEEQED